MHHARAITADILAEEKDAIRLLKIVERDGSNRYTYALRKRHRGTLVAHI